MGIEKSELSSKRGRPDQVEGQRPRSVQQTRLLILKSARELFSEDSYDHVTIRDIAAKSGCNSSLIARYFGSKEGLFREAIVDSINVSLGPRFAMASQFVDYVPNWITGKYRQDAFDPSGAIFRSASVPPAKEMLREAIEDHFIGPIARLISPTESQLRAEVLAAVLYGLNAFRNVIGTTELASVTATHLSSVIQPLLRELMMPEQRQAADKSTCTHAST